MWVESAVRLRQDCRSVLFQVACAVQSGTWLGEKGEFALAVLPYTRMCGNKGRDKACFEKSTMKKTTKK